MLESHGSIAVGKKASVIITKAIPGINFIPYSFTGDFIDKVILDGKIVFEK